MFRKCLYIGIAVICGALSSSDINALPFPAPLEYQQTMTKIFSEEDVQGWPEEYPEQERGFSGITVSKDGSKIGFYVYMCWGSCYYRLYHANTDGTGLTDVTSLMGEIPQWEWGKLKMNNDGSRFFVGKIIVQYIDTATNDIYPVFTNDGGWDADNPYFINYTGSRAYFYNGKNEESALKYVDIGSGSYVPMMGLGQLPCETQCGYIENYIRVLGVSAFDDRFVFKWVTVYDGEPAQSAMWYVYPGQNPVRMPDEEHDDIWYVQNLLKPVVSGDGTLAVYHEYEDTVSKTYLANLTTGEKRLVSETYPDFYVTLSHSGKKLRLGGTNHYLTIVDTTTLEKRDTGSYYFQPSTCNNSGYSSSQITEDDRYYYMAGKCGTNTGKIYKVDMLPDGTGPSPRIESISFNAPAILNDDKMQIAVEAAISDEQGLENIESVILRILVEGREQTDWIMARPPLAFPDTDYSHTLLYDDGTNGDAVAGDGIYSFDAIRTRGYSEWFDHYTPPSDIGVRIIVKDVDENYAIADTVLTITDQPRGDLDDSGGVDIADVIWGLQLVSGNERVIADITWNDINADGVIGLEETLSILRYLADL